MFQAKSYQDIAPSSKNGSLAQSTISNPYLEHLRKSLKTFIPMHQPKTLSPIQTSLPKILSLLLEENFAINIIKKCLNKQTKLLFDLNRVTQNLSYLQEAMLDYQTATQQLKDLDPENSIEKKLQKLRNILIESIQEWISDDVLVKLDHKYQQWQKAVSQTRLSQQSFPTYQEIEDKFIKLQKIMDVLKN